MTVAVHVYPDWAKELEEEVDERRHDDGQRHSGETLVENAGFTLRKPNTTRSSRERAECLGMQPMMTDLGTERAVLCLEGGLGETPDILN